MEGVSYMSHVTYKVNENTSKKMPVKLIYISRSEYDQDWCSLPHSHHFTEIFYIVKGKGSFVLADCNIHVKENDLVILNPFVDHTESSSFNDPMEYIALGVEGLSFFDVAQSFSKNQLYIYQGNRQEILFYLNKIMSEMQHKENDCELICQNLLEILMIKLQREKNFKLKQVYSKRVNKDIAFICQYLKHNHRKKITLHDLAKKRHMNKYYLAHSFKKEMGISPIDYLNKVRINQSKLLLETTDFKISEIAEMTGFSSQSFFSQSFKKITKQTPSKYRKEAQKNIT